MHNTMYFDLLFSRPY